jgi:hypothetical protein
LIHLHINREGRGKRGRLTEEERVIDGRLMAVSELIDDINERATAYV